jgi:SAM-dependent methyltransferase
MIRYVGAALALKAFSMNGLTRSLYRQLGNVVGGSVRQSDAYLQAHLERGKLFLDLTERYGLRRGGERMLEIGTGWEHWHTLFHRLHADARITMFDVWDCRQFDALKAKFHALEQWDSAAGDAGLPAPAKSRLHQLLECENIEQLYELLDLDYVVDRTGSIASLSGEQFDCIFSFHVLEHVPDMRRLAQQINASLRPGGITIHQIGIDDHLTHYDSRESPKNYLRFSDRTWKLFFENELQFQNRLQPSEFLTIFEDAGLECLEATPKLITPDRVPPVDKKFEPMADEDLRCTLFTTVHRKPD